VGVVVQRFDVYLVALDPTVGYEIRKTRPCLVVSPDEMNAYIETVIVAPMTGTSRPYPSRIDCNFAGRSGQAILDQLRAVDKTRLVKKLGTIDETVQDAVLEALQRIFAKGRRLTSED
jgi:mRNA interferase MazF